GSPARVLDVKSATARMVFDAIKQTKGRVFVFDDVINPLPPVRRRAAESVEELRRIAAWLTPQIEPVDDSGTGAAAKLYCFDPAAGDSKEVP
ncbi:MAG TPA: hypothetical protein VJ904_04280, partial [Tichowtungia sp.]|nr:hypothetical protein [Tichowtungia sp.]